MTAGFSLAGESVLVTGAAGFLGRHLCDGLAAVGARVQPLTRRVCDLSDRAAVSAAVADLRPAAVFHLAAARRASTDEERRHTTAVNTMCGAWVLEAVPDTCRFVLRLGSSTEYAASSVPMDEQTPLRPRGFFGATKAAGSLLFTAAAELRNIRSCVLRAFQVYGPGDKPDRFVPTVLDAARTGRPLPLTGPGLRRDWVWAGDVVRACLLAADRDDLTTGSVLNIGTGVQTSNEELVDLVGQVTGRIIDTRPGTHPGRGWDTADWVCDPSAALRALDWTPQVDMTTGLRRCWDTE